MHTNIFPVNTYAIMINNTQLNQQVLVNVWEFPEGMN